MEIDHIEDPILRIIKQYENHPSIVAINEKNLNKPFSFDYIPRSDVEREMLDLVVSKASQDSDVTTKIIKMNADIFAEVLYKVFNRTLEVGEFPSGMRLANVTAVDKKGSQYDKGSYRPLSILPNLSKIFEICLHKQISDFFLYDSVKISMRFQEMTWCAALFNSPTREMARKYRSRTRI